LEVAMSRKASGNAPETQRKSEALQAFARLLQWHLDKGTRPDGSPDTEGAHWTAKEFSPAVGKSERAVRGWLKGETPPDDPRPIERELFGTNFGYGQFRNELRRAYNSARSSSGDRGHIGPQREGADASTATGPESFIHDPGLCLGRDAEIDQLAAGLASIERGATILVLGDAGHGKTTITEKVGRRPEIIKRFGDRRWFVELERADSAEAALAAIAKAIGLEPTAPKMAVEARLATKPALMILDNLETPLHADARQTDTLLCDLASVDGLPLMASLRSKETVSGVPWSDQIWIEPLKPDIAKMVFLSIAPKTKESDPDLDYFIAELDGIPLAIRLVAKRASTRRGLADLRRQWERRPMRP
jgi:hypothetical protein